MGAEGPLRIAVVSPPLDAVRAVRAIRSYRARTGRDVRAVALGPDRAATVRWARDADEAVTTTGPLWHVDAAGGPAGVDPAAVVAALQRARATTLWAADVALAADEDLAAAAAGAAIALVGPDAATRRAVAAWMASRPAADGRPAHPAPAGPEAGGDLVLEVVLVGGAGGATVADVQRRWSAPGGGTGLVSVPDAPALAVEAAVALVTSLGIVGPVTVAVRAGDDGAVATDLRLGLSGGHALAGAMGRYDPAMIVLDQAVGDGDPRGGGLQAPSGGLAGALVAIRLHHREPVGAHDARVALVRPAAVPGTTIDAAVEDGDTVPVPCGVLAEIAAVGDDPDDALCRLHDALAASMFVVAGADTDQRTALAALTALAEPEFPSDAASGTRPVGAGASDGAVAGASDGAIAGASDGAADGAVAGASDGALAGASDGALADVASDPRRRLVALVVAAIDAADNDLLAEQAAFYARARQGRPETRGELRHPVQLGEGDVVHRFEVGHLGSGYYVVAAGGAEIVVAGERLGAYERRVRIGPDHCRAVVSAAGSELTIEVDGAGFRLTRGEDGIVRAPGPGVVVSVPVSVGDVVRPTDPIAVVESMKLERAIPARHAGRVRQVFIRPNVQVPAGAPLVEIDRSDAGEAHSAGGGAGADADTAPEHRPPSEPGEPELVALARGHGTRSTLPPELLVRNVLLGYDIDPAAARAAVDALPAGAEDDLLELVTDRLLLFRPHRESEEHDLRVSSSQEHLYAYLRSFDPVAEGVPAEFVGQLRRVVARYGLTTLEPGPDLSDALYRVFLTQQRAASQASVVIALLERVRSQGPVAPGLRDTLDRLITAAQQRDAVTADLTREVRFELFDAPVLAAARERVYQEVETLLAALVRPRDGATRQAAIDRIVGCPQPVAPLLLGRLPAAVRDDPEFAGAALEAITRRYYRRRRPDDFRVVRAAGRVAVRAEHPDVGAPAVHIFSIAVPFSDLTDALVALDELAADVGPHETAVVDAYTWDAAPAAPSDVATICAHAISAARLRSRIGRIVVALGAPGSDRRMSALQHHTFRRTDPTAPFTEDGFLRGLHPLMASRLQLSRLRAFDLERLPAADDVYLFCATARTNPKDERLFGLAEVRDLTPVHDRSGAVVGLPELERALLEVLAAIRAVQAPRPVDRRYQWNRVTLHLWPPLELSLDEITAVARRMAPATEGLGIEQIAVLAPRRDPESGVVRERELRLSNPGGRGFVIEEREPPTDELRPLDDYTQKVVQSRRRGTVYPHELARMITARDAGRRTDGRGGEFVELDLTTDPVTGLDELRPAGRAPGGNVAGVVLGVVTNRTDRYPEGMRRIAIFGDPTKALGSLAEPECRRILAALRLAATERIPLEWYALSSGARIAKESGTENMDWIAAVLRGLIDHTQDGHEINVIVTGINVGGQPYWNAEATMLMHTKGILVMTPESAMVLTGKQALDYSGGVSAEDNLGIGGYERIMGPNGQAQYWAPDLDGAIGVLLAHYDHTYVAPGERFPRRAATSDPLDRDVCTYPHALRGSPFRCIGDVFDPATNPDRKLPFDIRTMMRSVTDQDHEPLERWRDLRDADTGVVWDAKIGGWPVLLLGFESHSRRRRGGSPADGPDHWTAGTLFPMSSKKIARAINTASGNRPLVVLANLSGFDGSPDSMRSLQLEYGAEIGRAVVNFRGPIVFCVVSRYHGGAFVVFSRRLNESMETLAVEGSRASVIGGAPAAAVVFAGEVASRTRSDVRVQELEKAVRELSGAERAEARARLADVTAAVRAETLGKVADEFDAIHTVERARDVGSVDRIIAAHHVRPEVIAAIERGIARERTRR